MLEVKWKEGKQPPPLPKERCFNPCYVGSKMERKVDPDKREHYFEFQSLLCWK